MSRNIVAFSVDNNYIEYAAALVRSICEHHITAGVICRGINLTQKNKDRLLKIKPSLEFIDDTSKLSRKRTLMKRYENPEELFWTYSGSVYDMRGLRNITKTMYSPQAAYACHSRFLSINSILSTDCDRLLYLDADTIVNRNFDMIWRDDDYDLCVVPYGKKQTLFNNEGLLLINNTPAVFNFFKHVRNRIFEGDTYLEWDADTRILNEVFEQNPINIKKIDKSYKDKQHKPDSYMWSGDGPRKTKTKFQNIINNGTD